MHIACSAKFIIAKFSTYGKYGMNYPALFVCLFVCQQLHIKTTDRIFDIPLDKEITVKFLKSSGSEKFLNYWQC